MKSFSSFLIVFSPLAIRVQSTHFGPLECWVNDPAGLVYYDGWYHLFFQVNPTGITWGNMHWGHAVSRDLVRWQIRPIAISPHPELGLAFTGSVVVDTGNCSGLFDGSEDGFVAFLTTAKERKSGEGHVQTQSIAYSRDRGETWNWYEYNPVIPDDGRRDFRDPRVFWDRANDRWCAVVSRGKELVFYASDDLLHWDTQSSFSPPAVPDLCECPDVIQMEHEGRSVWVLAYSIAPDSHGGGAGVRYQIGTYDGVTFIPDEHGERQFDFGYDFYALQSWYGRPRDLQPVAIAWANNPAYSHAIPQIFRGANGMMTLPRRLSLRSVNGQLLVVQEPVGPGDESFEDISSSADAGSECRVFSLDEGCVYRVDAGDSSGVVKRAQIEVRSRNGFALTMDIDVDEGVMNVRREVSEHKIPPLEYAREIPLALAPLDIVLLIDHGIAELFLSGGIVAATHQLFNEDEPLEMRTWFDGNARHVKLRGRRLSRRTINDTEMFAEGGGMT